jgi:hypothetical protein
MNDNGGLSSSDVNELQDELKMCHVHDDFRFILRSLLIEILTGRLGAKQAPLISSVWKWSTFFFVSAAILQIYAVRPLHAQILAGTTRQSETARQSIVDILRCR